MLRNLMFGAAAIALMALSTPASAQVALSDVEIEGPMSHVEAYPQPVQDSGYSIIGKMTVMGADVRVLETALIHTPTNSSNNPDPADRLTLADFQTGRLPGRSQQGFTGGTAIVVGESLNGVIYASDVFSDLAENVVVGEATGKVTITRTEVIDGVEIVTGEAVRSTINGMVIRPQTDRRMPAGPAINGFGLRVDANDITVGTLVAAEGYYVPSQNTLWYHTLEADGAKLLNPSRTQVGILRASCRIRGGGRDELEVRGGTVNPANASVQIRLPAPTVANPDRFLSVGIVQAVPQPATVPGDPPQGLFRADFRNLNIAGGVCPSQVRAVILAGGTGVINQASATADLEGR